MRKEEDVFSFFVYNHENSDLAVFECGYEKCAYDKDELPRIHQYYDMHYILNGKGTIIINNNIYELKKGDIFILPPGIITTYYPDKNDPWEYYWIGFGGIKAKYYLERANIDIQLPILDYNKDDNLQNLFERLIDSYNDFGNTDITCLGLLLLMFGLLADYRNPKHTSLESTSELYAKKAIGFIENNFHKDIDLSDISNYLNINPNYFCSLFKNIIGCSPKQYLIHYRIDKACELLRTNDLSISQVSKMVGFNDPLYFSKAFTKIKAINPSKFID